MREGRFINIRGRWKVIIIKIFLEVRVHARYRYDIIFVVSLCEKVIVRKVLIERLDLGA